MLDFRMRALTQDQVEDIHQKTLEMLEQHGICMEYDRAVEIFKKHGASADGHLVKIPRSVVERALKTAPSRFALWAREKKHCIEVGRGCAPAIGPAAGVVCVSDINGRRMATFDDFINFQKLAQTSESCSFGAAGMLYPIVSDGSEALKKQLRLAVEYTSKPLLGLTQNERVSRMSIDMMKALSPDAPHYVMGVVNSISPLKWDENMLGSIIEFAQANQPMVIACCSMAGFTSALSLSETIASNNVELIAGIVLAQLVNPGTPVVYGNTSAVTDMRTFGLAIGSPEYALLSVCASQMAEFYNLPYRSGGGLTDAKTFDFQCGAESATNLFVSLNNDVSVMLHALGVMESFMAINYEKWIADEEIIERVLRVRKGVGNVRPDIVSVMAEKGPGGTYITDDETIFGFKDELHIPNVFDRTPYDSWAQKGIVLEKKAHDAVSTRLEAYVKPDCPASILVDLDRIALAQKL